MTETRPLVRTDLDFIPLIHEGKRMVLVRDAHGLVREGLALPQQLFEFMAMLDGRRDTGDLQVELMRRSGGSLVGVEEVKNLVERLDSWNLLDSERFRNEMSCITAQFASLPTRPCALSGRSYPGDPDELRTMLEEIISSAAPSQATPVKGIVAPHIDLTAGKRSYGAAYASLKHTRPTRVLILGTGHRMADGWFCVTEKDFETPLGTAACDRKSVLRLRHAGEDVVSGNDFAHKSEHSIEFQVLFLQHLLPLQSFSIVPILCGGLTMDPGTFGRAAYLEKAGGFLKTLRDLAAEPDHATLIVAGVDFSHIGLKFGHTTSAPSLESAASAHDRTLLDRLTAMDGDGFWREMLRVEDRFNVCGFPALACLLEILPPAEGAVLDYGIYREEATGSSVTFAAAAFTARRERVEEE